MERDIPDSFADDKESTCKRLPQTQTIQNLGKREREEENDSPIPKKLPDSLSRLLNQSNSDEVDDFAPTSKILPTFQNFLENVENQPRLPSISTLSSMRTERTSVELDSTPSPTPILLPTPSFFYNPLSPRQSNSFQQLTPPSLSFQPRFHHDELYSPVPEHRVFFPLSDNPNRPLIIPSNTRESPSEESDLEICQMNPEDHSSSGLFILLEQPNEIQRKSYKRENRCLLPNPFIICMRELTEEEKKSPPEILKGGVVHLKLVNADGLELPPHKQNALESVDGGLVHYLDQDHTTCFSAKALETSEGVSFRLVFLVSYQLKGVGKVNEKIISRSFSVYSNKHNRNSKKKQRQREALAGL